MFFRKKKAEKAESADLLSVDSASSQVSPSKTKIKNLFRSPKASESHDSLSPEPVQLSKRISTIAEDNYSGSSGDDDFDSSGDSSNESSQLSDDPFEDDEGSESEEELHDHLVQLKKPTHNLTQQLTHLMGYCGIPTESDGTSKSVEQLANEELKRTFSLLGQNVKIHRLSPSVRKADPDLHTLAIDEYQVKLINCIKDKLNALLDSNADLKNQYALIGEGKSLYDRYGVVKKVIGRGSYGLIKIIFPNSKQQRKKKTEELEILDLMISGQPLYAVKELFKRPENENKPQESRAHFIDRVVSEFIISATLNSKYIVKTVDLMVTLPLQKDSSFNYKNFGVLEMNFKVSQVMECTPGGDLFSYLKALTQKTLNHSLPLDEFDCFIKQIAKGLWYMHQHGVAHCDLKLENILISYDFSTMSSDRTRASINLKLSDFGKSNVFRTTWDNEEQLTPYSDGPAGSEPYIAPEEYCKPEDCSKRYQQGYSLVKKDCWALGIIILVLFNVRRHYFYPDSTSHSETIENLKNDDEFSNDFGVELFSEYSSSYLWHSTEKKRAHISKEYKFKDKVFAEYVKTYMQANYNDQTKEWLITRQGSFKPIESLFAAEDLADGDDASLCELRKYFIYKLLDVNPETRMTTSEFMRGDWMLCVEIC